MNVEPMANDGTVIVAIGIAAGEANQKAVRDEELVS
jgi:hypothetical protein